MFGLFCWLIKLLVLILIRSPPKIPQVHIPEKPVLEFASALRVEINRAFALLRDIASGRDLKKFLSVCCFPFIFCSFPLGIYWLYDQ